MAFFKVIFYLQDLQNSEELSPKNDTAVGSRTHTETFASTLRVLSLSWTEWRGRLSLSMQYHAHALNVRVDRVRSSRGFGQIEEPDVIHAHWMSALALWRPVVASDRLKNQTWYTPTGAIQSAGSGLVENCRLMFHA
jgi:hypothetical protein